jgi:hypothetical protein
MNSRSKKSDDLENLRLLARNSEEKAAEAAIFAEQLSRSVTSNVAP